MTRARNDMESLPPSLDELLAHTGWVRALARRLARDPATADDLEQDTWLATLRRPPSSRANLRTWLARVVAHRAASLGRSETRRARRERAHAALEALPATDELLGALDQQARVAAAVRELEEPYRTTLLLHFYRGLAPAEIARREDVPPGTVRSRLKRGLDLLRARFDAEHGGDRRAWSVALLAWAGPEEVALGGLGLAVVAGLFLTVAGCGAWLAWRAYREPQSAPEVATTGESDEDHGRAPRPDSPAKASPDARRELGDTTSSTPVVQGTRFYGHVYAPDFAPVVGAALSLLPSGVDAESAPLATGSTDEQGRFEFVLGEGGETPLLRVSAPGFVPYEQKRSPETELAIGLRWSVEVAGIVRDSASGAPLAGASLSSRDRNVRSDSEGQFRLGGFPSGQRSPLLVAVSGFAPHARELFVRGPEACWIELELASARELELEVVSRESGLPVRDAEVFAFDASGPRLATTDAHGLATVPIATGQKLAFEIVHPDHFGLQWSWTPAPSEPRARVTLPLAPKHWIEGRAHARNGAPVADAWVVLASEATWRSDTTLAQRFGIPGELYERNEPASDVSTDATGGFRIAAFASEHLWQVHVGCEGFFEATASLLVAEHAGGPHAVELTLEPAAVLRGQVLHGGQPFWGERLVFRALDGTQLGETYIANGLYVFHALPAGEGELVLCEENGEVAGAPRTPLVLGPGERKELDIVWGEPQVALTGRVRDEHGRPVPGATVFASAFGRATISFVMVDASGAFMLFTPPGIEVLIRAWKGAAFDDSQWQGPAGSSDVELVLASRDRLSLLVLEAGSRAPVDVGHIPASNALAWRRTDGANDEVDADIDPSGRLELDLAPGTYDVTLHLDRSGYRPASLQGLIVADEDSPVHELLLERGLDPWVRLEPVPTESDGFSHHLVFLVEESQLGSIAGPYPEQGPPSNHRINGICMRLDDATLIEQLLSRGNFASTGRARLFGLKPGRYVAKSYPDDYVFDPATLELTGPGPHELVLRWRRR